MRIFNIEVKVMGILGAYTKVVHQRANHLQGAIRQIYQNERVVRIVRILEEL